MPSSVSDDLNGLASELDRFTAEALGKAALEVKKLMLNGVRPYTGGDLRLSNVGKRGAKLNVRYDYQRGSRGKAVRVRAVGPWQFIEYDRKRGYPIPKRKKSRKNPGRKLHIGDDWVTGPVRGGSLRGRKPWARTLPKAMAQVSDIFAKEFAQVVRKA